MKIKLYSLLFVFLPVIVSSQDLAVLTNSIEYNRNYVYIFGETNLNCFECKYVKNNDHRNTYNVLVKYPQIPGQTIETYIPVSEFECSNYLMYNDFQELLKAYEYPFIKIEVDPNQIRNILPDNSLADLNISISIANITNIQLISCSVNNYSNSTVNITGKATIHLVDYQIKPPVKFMGLVKVKDEVTISFSFNFIVA